MAGVVGKLNCKLFTHVKNGYTNSRATFTSFRTLPTSKKIFLVASGAVTAGSAALVYCLQQSVNASGGEVHPPHFPWSHMASPIASLDHASIRRGYEVYKQVCAACHSMKYVSYRELIDVSHSRDEVTAEAEEVQIEDGPDEEGKMFKRPGRRADYFPNPYPNDQAARAANNGSLPPDLSLIVFGRHGGEDYIFSLLTGYTDPPAGVTVQEGLHYNPYFAGGAIGMARALYNEVIEYQDGTPATTSQMAKDVTTFLRWAAEPEHDERKLILIKAMLLFVPLTVISYFFYRRNWTSMWSRKIIQKPK